MNSYMKTIRTIRNIQLLPTTQETKIINQYLLLIHILLKKIMEKNPFVKSLFEEEEILRAADKFILNKFKLLEFDCFLNDIHPKDLLELIMEQHDRICAEYISLNLGGVCSEFKTVYPIKIDFFEEDFVLIVKNRKPLLFVNSNTFEKIFDPSILYLKHYDHTIATERDVEIDDVDDCGIVAAERRIRENFKKWASIIDFQKKEDNEKEEKKGDGQKRDEQNKKPSGVNETMTLLDEDRAIFSKIINSKNVEITKEPVVENGLLKFRESDLGNFYLTILKNNENNINYKILVQLMVQVDCALHSCLSSSLYRDSSSIYRIPITTLKNLYENTSIKLNVGTFFKPPLSKTKIGEDPLCFS